MPKKAKSHFIKEIEIKHFKCFADFKAEGFGRVNLIGGKNNVGKTAFMEAVLLTNQLQYSLRNFVISLLSVEEIRNQSKPINKNRYIEIMQKLSILELVDENDNHIKISFDSDNLKNTIIFNKKEMNISDSNLEIAFKKYISSFVASCMRDDGRAELLYNGVKENRKREELNKFIRKFDKDFLEIDVIDNVFKIFSESRNSWIDIHEYGNGIKHFIIYASAILGQSNTLVYIDEIENGIHYTNLDKLWEIILTISKQQNVQVFATTHSKECIESYARVAEELKDKDITFFKLGKNQQGELKGMVYPYDWFVDSVEQEQELRGW